MKHRTVAATAVFLFPFLTLSPRPSRPATDGAVIVKAAQNFSADPWGRVVDVTFDREHPLNLTQDTVLFEVDLVRPLARDASFCVDDLNNDGLDDLFGSSFDGTALFFPGVDPQRPFLFGNGQLVRQIEALGSPFNAFASADWEGCAIADVDGDGNKDIVVGRDVYHMVTPGDPTLLTSVAELAQGFLLDPFVSAVDWDDDGDDDILLTTSTVPARLWLYRNRSTPGNLSFTPEVITNSYVRNFLGERGLAAGDFNQDGLFDLISFRGIYYQGGQPGDPEFDFDNPTPYAVEEGPWVDGVSSDQGISIFPRDADGDGLLDVFVSNYGTSVWQGAYYRNVGTARLPAFRFVSPLLARSAPYDHGYRSHDEPSFSGERPYAATGDPDRNGTTDLLVTADFVGQALVLWNRGPNGTAVPAGSNSSAPTFSYQDDYSFPTPGFPELTRPFDPFNPYWLPNVAIAFRDFTADGLEDIVSESIGGLANGALSFHRRTDFYPIKFAGRAALKTRTGQDIRGLGWAEIDLNGDQIRDLILGVPPNFPQADQRGKLQSYLNSDDTGKLDLADPQPLMDNTGTAIDVGVNAWPINIDWDGDGDEDLLIGNQSGEILIYLNQARVFHAAGQVGAEDWVPIDHGLVGGSLLTPSLAAADVVGDGETDLVMGDSDTSLIWLFENRRAAVATSGDPPGPAASSGTTGASPELAIHVASVSRTIPGRMEKLGADSYRLYFGIPVVAGESSLFYYREFGSTVPQQEGITQQLSLYFPYFRQGPGLFTGFAGSDYSERAAQLEFKAYRQDGTTATFPTNPSRFPLERGSQLAILGNQIFGLGASVKEAAWVEGTSDNPLIGSFFQFGTSNLQQLDGSVAFNSLTKEFFFTRVYEGPGTFRGHNATTWLTLANPTTTRITVALTLHRAADMPAPGPSFPKIRFIPAKGFIHESVADMFGGASVSGGYIEVEVQSGGGAVGFQTIEFPEVSTVVGLNPSIASNAETAYSAQFAASPMIFTNINVINTSRQSRRLILTAIEAGGTSLEVAQVELAPGEQRGFEGADLVAAEGGSSLQGFQGSTFVGSLRLDSDGDGIVGDAMFGDPIALQFAANLLLQTRPFRRAIFSHVANLSNFFTGLAFFAEGPGDTTIRVEVFSSEGDRVGAGERVLGEGERLSELLTQIVPASEGQAGGYILVTATNPVIGQLLFGALNASQQITLFSAVPPAVIL